MHRACRRGRSSVMNLRMSGLEVARVPPAGAATLRFPCKMQPRWGGGLHAAIPVKEQAVHLSARGGKGSGWSSDPESGPPRRLQCRPTHGGERIGNGVLFQKAQRNVVRRPRRGKRA